MTNAEAIKWLELQRSVGIQWDDDSEKHRPFREEAEKRISEAYSMAIDALREQEARVLSWEEVKKSGSAYRCVEIYSPQVRRLALINCIVRQSETIPELYYLFEDSGVSWCRAEAEYNRGCWQGTVSGWRCWTARPTDEQRRTVKWDE